MKQKKENKEKNSKEERFVYSSDLGLSKVNKEDKNKNSN